VNRRHVIDVLALCSQLLLVIFRKDGIGKLTTNRPEKMNAFTGKTMNEMSNALVIINGYKRMILRENAIKFLNL